MGNVFLFCQFNAIAKVKNDNFIFNELCHSCGSCVYFCPTNALQMQQIWISKLMLTSKSNPFFFGQGILNIGENYLDCYSKIKRTNK